MGCNASQEPIIVPNENGNITTSTAVDDDTLNDAEQQHQSELEQELELKQSPQPPPSVPEQQSYNNQSEPDVSISATNNSNNMRDGSSSISSNGNGSASPDNKTMTPKSVTPFSSSPLSSVASPPTKRHEEGFVGHKIESANGPPLAPPAIDNGNQEQQQHPKQNSFGEGGTAESPRVQSATTKASSAASSTRSASQKSFASVEKGEESMTANRLEICSDGASDLANNLANSITETNNEDDSTIQFGNEEVEAATKIQAIFRGHKVRATIMKPGDDDSSTKGAASANDESAGAAKTPTKDEFEAEFDPNDKELCEAAVRIQATFRGHLARKGKELKDEKDIQEITKKVAEELDIDLADPELNKAASKIQATFRRTRKD